MPPNGGKAGKDKATGAKKETKPEVALVESIKSRLDNGEISSAQLQTDDRVLARITDGIYRQPSSALRELIANAYDADATEVYIQTDAPRFSRISVKDNGRGLSIESLAHLIFHIGGSPKRDASGVPLGVVSKRDITRSPGGRKLIGKIGIGLFSVAQLTRHFQIITKTPDSKHRLVAEVILNTYGEEPTTVDESGAQLRRTGSVRIWSVPAQEGGQGTEIILLNLRPQSRRILRSEEDWTKAFDAKEGDQKYNEELAPAYHVGFFEDMEAKKELVEKRLPWGVDTPPEEKFGALYDAVQNLTGSKESTPKLKGRLTRTCGRFGRLACLSPLTTLASIPSTSRTRTVFACFSLAAWRGSRNQSLCLTASQFARS